MCPNSIKEKKNPIVYYSHIVLDVFVLLLTMIKLYCISMHRAGIR